jgi:hypothetical protein
MSKLSERRSKVDDDTSPLHLTAVNSHRQSTSAGFKDLVFGTQIGAGKLQLPKPGQDLIAQIRVMGK